MKMIILLITLVGLVSCGSTPVKETKIKIAEGMKNAVVLQLEKSYKDVVIPNYSCDQEIVEIGNNVYNEVAKTLKIEREATVQTSLVGGALIRPICKLIGAKYLPSLVEGTPESRYQCLRMLGSDGLKKLSNQLCDLIPV